MSRAIVIALALLSGCASSSEESRSQPVVLEPSVAQLASVQLMKTDPPPACAEVGSDFEIIVWGDFEGARRKLRRNALERGGNWVRLETPAGGTIYRCPVARPATSQPMDPYAPAAGKITEVRMMKADPPSSCAEVGVVSETIWVGDVEGARSRLRVKALELGANYVRLEMPTTGTAFRCP